MRVPLFSTFLVVLGDLPVLVSSTPTFTIDSGDCTAPGTCFYTPNYPSNYGYSQTCTITANYAVTLYVEDFYLEYSASCSYDYLTLAGTKYCGSGVNKGPNNMEIAAGTVMTFTSDYGASYSGFEICGTRGPTLGPTLQPSPRPTQPPSSSPAPSTPPLLASQPPYETNDYKVSLRPSRIPTHLAQIRGLKEEYFSHRKFLQAHYMYWGVGFRKTRPRLNVCYQNVIIMMWCSWITLISSYPPLPGPA